MIHACPVRPAMGKIFLKGANFDGFVKSPNFDGFVKCSRSRLANPEE
jgi:hypothetical protein